MANEELIDEYIDRQAFKAETDFAVNEVNKLLASFDSLKKAKADIASSKGLVDISAAVRQSEKDTQLLLRTQQQLANTKRAEIQLDNELLKNAKLKEQAADRLIKKEQEIAKAKSANSPVESITKTGNNEALKQTGTVVNELDKAQAEAAISATEFGNSLNKSAKLAKDSSKAVDGTRKSTHDLNKELELKKQLDRQAAQELKNTVREENAVKGSLEQRRAALIRLNAVYDNLGPQERASASGKRLFSIIGGLSTQVKTLEADTNRAQRNVGNYGSAFDKVSGGVTKAFGALRTLAKILPGVGISGLFLIGFEAVKKFIDAINNAKAALFGLSEQRKLSASIEKTAAESAGKEAASLTILRTQIESTIVPMAKRLQAIKDIKAQYPEYFKGLTNEQLLTGNVADAYDRATQAILRKARANAAAAELEKIASEKFEILRKAEEARELANEKIANAKARVAQGRIKEFDTKEEVQKEIRDKANIRAKGFQEEIDLLNKKQAFLRKFIESGANETITIDEEKEKKARRDNLQTLKEITDNEFKEYEIRQKRKISNFERDLASDKVHYLDKIVILKQFYDASKELLIKAAEEEKRLALEKANSEIQKLQEDKAGKSVAEVQRINDNIAIIETNLATQLKTINVKLKDDLVALAQTTSDKKVKIDEDYVRKKKEALDQELEYEKQLADSIEALRKSRLSTLKEFEAAELQLFKDTQNKKVEAATAAYKFLFSLGDAFYQRQLNLIKQQQDDIDVQKEAELAANDARVQSEQDKAANILIINQRAQTEKDKLERKAKEIELQRARFDRAQQAFEIGIQTIKSIAEIKAKAATLAASGNPLIAALAVKALAQIPLVLATSAASIGALFAMPLPRLFRGKKKGQSVGEAALLNDHPNGVTTEVIERANGDIEFPQGRNVVSKIGVNDIVHPDKDAWINAILGAATRDTAAGMKFKPSGKGDNQLAAAMAQQTKLLKQIANKKELHLGATDRGMTALWQYGSNQATYINENTNW